MQGTPHHNIQPKSNQPKINKRQQENTGSEDTINRQNNERKGRPQERAIPGGEEVKPEAGREDTNDEINACQVAGPSNYSKDKTTMTYEKL